MKKLLTAFLYQYKNCPLPTVGSLILQPGHAKHLPGENKILAPIPFVQLIDKETTPYSLVNFIAQCKNISSYQASELLKKFCDRLQQLAPTQELALSNAGSFFINEEGKLSFKSLIMPASFLPEALAQRVVHPDVAHHILVGDKETNSTVMTQMLNQNTTKNYKWGIAALGMGLLAVVILLIYYNNNSNGSFGSAKKVKVTMPSNSYRTNNK